MKIGQKLMFGFLGISLIPLLITAYLAVNRQAKIITDYAIQDAVDVANTIEEIITHEPPTLPIYLTPDLQKLLSDYIAAGRDFVMIDANKVILADAVTKNIGTVFTHDTGNEVGLVIKTGSAQTFREISPDYPKGINIVAVPLKSEGKTVGAVLLEYKEAELEKMQAVAEALAVSISHKPIGIPLYYEKQKLQSFVGYTSERMKRDIEVVDLDKKIIADTVVEDIGQECTIDTGGEIRQTMKDKKPRAFKEISPDYPKGIHLVVVALTKEKVGVAKEEAEVIGAVVTSYAPLFEPALRDFRDLMVGIALMSVLVILALAFLIAQGITKPIIKLKNTAIEIGKGKLETRVEIKSKDEIGTLASAFNEMAEDLGAFMKKERELVAAAASERAKMEAVEERAKKLTDSRTAMIHMLKRLDKTGKELAAARDYTDNIIKSMIDTLLVVDPDGKIKTINKATSDLLGYKENELVGKPVATIFAEEEEEEEEEEETPFKGTKMQKLIDEGSIRDYNMTYKTKTGDKIPVSFSGSVMRDKGGNLIGIVGIARDMREIKHLQEKLVRSEKLAALGQLSTNVAHEIRNPLGIIRTSTYYLKSSLPKDNKKISKHLEILERESVRASNIISDILEFSRPMGLEYQPTNVNEQIEEVLVSLKEHKFQPENVNLDIHLSDDLPNIQADTEAIRRVFMNTITNALEAMPKGGKLKISTELSEKDKMIKIIISDTGTGIPKEMLTVLYEPFTTTKKKGMGLGLAIAYGIIDRHKGSIDVASQINKGTTFTITLPMEENE